MKRYLFVMAAVLFLELVSSALKASGSKFEDHSNWTKVGDVIVYTALLVWTLALITS